ncbi:MAG: hypothetical protein G01um101416_130 [Microgenomates group bacterium Gr01-1014_16]|nr:MAG: hypothetical protein G01um101416_130 [Microgenomates group bacterium Gr01-1014_16]
MKTKILFILLLLTSPSFWLVMFHLPQALGYWQRLPQSIVATIKSKSQSQYLIYIDELRWAGRSFHRNDLLSRILYNKSLFVLNEFFDFIQYAQPKLYFLAGDGSVFSPRRLEPISSLLFPFWILGILKIIKDKKFLVPSAYCLFMLIGYASGQKNLALLFPVLILNVYISTLGLKDHKRIIPIILIYGVYITGMNIWLSIS